MPIFAIPEFTGEYRWLSNFWPCAINVSGDTFPSVENAYQSAKTLFAHQEFLTCSPAEAKRLGRELPVTAPKWDTVRIVTMDFMLREKFKAGTELAEQLLATGSKDIIEGNRWGDTFWGVCDGKGRNHLGKLIMTIRSELRLQRKIQLNTAYGTISTILGVNEP